MNILIVDDWPLIMQEMVRQVKLLRPSDACHGVTSGAEALELAKTVRFDVALLDIDMPEMDGLSLARELMKQQKYINIIFVTGYPSSALEAYEVYASGFLVKPVGEKQLEQALSNLRHPVLDLGGSFLPEHYAGANVIGTRLKRIRKDRGLSVKEVASRLGVTGQTIYRWESGERIPDVATFLQIGQAFGVTLDELLKD